MFKHFLRLPMGRKYRTIETTRSSPAGAGGSVACGVFNRIRVRLPALQGAEEEGRQSLGRNKLNMREREKGDSQVWAPWACLSMGPHGLRKDRRSGTPRLAASRQSSSPLRPRHLHRGDSRPVSRDSVLSTRPTGRSTEPRRRSQSPHARPLRGLAEPSRPPRLRHLRSSDLRPVPGDSVLSSGP